MDGSGDMEANRQIRVRFVTKLPPPLRVPSTSIAVPSNFTRMGLSEIVNTLLSSRNSEYELQPFDFIIDGELVRMSLQQFLQAKDISMEKTLEIEYIRAVAPRKQEDPSLHPDWVSAVDGSNSSFMLTGCCDSIGRIWKSSGLCTHTLKGHGDAVTSICFVNPKGRNNTLCIASASKDRTVRLWKFDADESLNNTVDSHPRELRPFKILSGHSSSVQCVSSGPLGDKVCSGSWDCSIKLWEIKESDAEGASVSVKKRKVATRSTLHEEPQLEAEAVATLIGHTQCVSSVLWPAQESLFSASWDHSIRRWDIETGKDILNLSCGKALNCVDVGGESSALIVAGGSDPILRVWDPRKPGTLAPDFRFSSHTSWITACKWHERSWYHLLSASYDGKVMLWDLRTAWPLAVINSHTDKVLCADWWKGDSVISGGADSKLCIASETCIS